MFVPEYAHDILLRYRPGHIKANEHFTRLFVLGDRLGTIDDTSNTWFDTGAGDQFSW